MKELRVLKIVEEIEEMATEKKKEMKDKTTP